MYNSIYLDRERMKKVASKQRLYIKLALALAFCVALGFYISYLHTFVRESIFFKGLDVAPWQVVGVMLGITAVMGVFSYLQPTQSKRGSTIIQYNGEGLSEVLNTHKEKLRTLEDKFDAFLSGNQGVEASSFLGDNEKEELKKLLVKRLEEENQVNLLVGIESRIFEKWRVKQAEDVYSKTVNRLERELLDQARRGNVNLVLGIATTLAGVGILGYSVFQAPIAQSSIELTSHFLPRLSLVILIEVFAYFFLRLYKQGLAEIKYFQNEITNIESKYLALNVSLSCGVDEGLLKVIERLLMTERNFVLEKGQSTVELEKMKSEQTQNANVAEKLSLLISTVKKD